MGYLQVYTGNGKGKTTAAFGLALRAAGAGRKVFIAQFLKPSPESAFNALKRIKDLITFRQYGRAGFVVGQPTDQDIQAAKDGLEDVKRVIASGQYQLVILDEVNVVTHLGLFSVGELLELVHSRPGSVELVITGRDADPRIIDAADLVTEMVEVKHYYRKGVQARPGIEK